MADPKASNVIRIRPYPKVIFFYPSVLLAIIYSVISLLGFNTVENQLANLIFMVVFSINMLIFAFDFSVLMFVIYLISVVLGTVVLFLWNSVSSGAVFGVISSALGSLRLGMNNHFYYFFSLLFIFIYLVVWIRTRFNYWDIRHNELFHREGIFADTKRINAPNLSYSREIPDVFEFILLRGGRIKLMPLNHEPFVIETVLDIKRKDKKIGDILSKMKVTMDSTGATHVGGSKVN